MRIKGGDVVSVVNDNGVTIGKAGILNFRNGSGHDWVNWITSDAFVVNSRVVELVDLVNDMIFNWISDWTLCG